VMAQADPPPPYAGMKNPFPWGGQAAVDAGKKIYQQSCQGCHGAKGESLPAFNFGSPAYHELIESKPDFIYWVTSEGRLSKGMPPFKSSLTEEKRWQLLTYMWSLGKAAPPALTPTPIPTLTTPPAPEEITLTVSAPARAQSGQPLVLTATLLDKQQPVKDAVVKFFIQMDFFTSGLMEIGEATTNEQGMATLEYEPREAGTVEVVARYKNNESRTTSNLTPATRPFYGPEVGVKLPTLGEEVFIGPRISMELGEVGQAPVSAFRIPGGLFSWLLFPVLGIILIWFTYLRAMFQVWRVAPARLIDNTNPKAVPLLGMLLVLGTGTLLVLMIVTGPYSHFHLFP
ncbi:MAG: c-type cytochrome, partial [Chloroflexi bacterium]|nr:c-type cytochrome [Chloroflexota bacterium]